MYKRLQSIVFIVLLMVLSVAAQATSFFHHPDYQKVELVYWLDSTTAYPLTIEADRLLRSILAEAGIFRAEISSTKRTFLDQATIMKTELSEENIAAWYGADVAEAVKNLSLQELEVWLRIGKPKISRHIAGYAIDVIVVNNELKLNDPENLRLRKAYEDVILRLLPYKENGVKFFLRENNGCEHTEFTFPVTYVRE